MHKTKEQVIIEAVVKLMENRSMWENTATELTKALRDRAGDYAHKIPHTTNLLSRKLNDNAHILAEHDIVMSRKLSGTRSIKFIKTTISTKSTKKENLMKTKIYKQSLRNEILEVIKELGPITVVDIADFTFSSVDSVRSTISQLTRQGHPIASKDAGKGTYGAKLYFWDNKPKTVVKRKEQKPVELVCKKVEKPKVTNQALLKLVDRAYYLMLALGKLDIELLIDHLELDEKTAEDVIFSMGKKYRKNMRIDITYHPKG